VGEPGEVQAEDPVSGVDREYEVEGAPGVDGDGSDLLRRGGRRRAPGRGSAGAFRSTLAPPAEAGLTRQRPAKYPLPCPARPRTDRPSKKEEADP